MKKFITFFFSLIFTFGYTQMDTEHWFAPMASGSEIIPNKTYSNLNLSTNEPVPFAVEIYSGNTLFKTVQISKGNPQVVEIPYQFMITSTSSQMQTVFQMGLHVKGQKKFFANYRFSIENHAEIITSKGLAGIGQTFYAAMAPSTISKSYVNATIGISATEDDTTVKVSGYDPRVVFSDGSSSPDKTFKLNKGESYILNAKSLRDDANRFGLIGAKIEASHPVSVTNGNFNGIYTFENNSNNDILMDQSVPIERLGNEFIMVKGNGPANNNMESALIIATEDDTQIRINGTDTGIVLQSGQYFIFGASYFKDQGNGHFNLSINTSKNTYVYQLLAGVEFGNPYATGGFNFIPALSCFLPNKIDEISNIDQIGIDTYNTKLNIITERGAIVSVNGTTLAGIQGPFPVTGNSKWETYTVKNITGNVTVNSTKSVTAGIAAGDDAVGYGGYFAGFSSVPTISKTGDCYSGVLLQVDDSYDQYQWSLNGFLIGGANSYFINPEIFGAGDYTCVITKNDCETKTTLPYSFKVCPPITSTTINNGSCHAILITPQLTSSSQTIVPSKTRVNVNPIYGTATVNPVTGIITYIPTANLSNDVSDLLVYYIEGNGTPEDSEYFKITIHNKVLQVNDDQISVCPAQDGTGVFNLSLSTITNNPTNSILYYEDQALTIPILNFSTFQSAKTVVFAKVTSTMNCSKIAKISLDLKEKPILDISSYVSKFCDTEFKGSIPITFTDVSPKIITNYKNTFTVSYYLNPADQLAGTNNYLPNNWSFSTDTTVYVRVDGNNGCPAVLGQINFSVGDKIILMNVQVTEPICDNLLAGNVRVELNDYVSKFTTDSTINYSYYHSEIDAKQKTNSISSTQTLSATKTYFIRFESSAACANIGKLTLNFKSPQKSTQLKDEIICTTSQIVLDAGSGFDSYQWSTGEKTATINAKVGTYYVDLGYNGCTYRQTVIVTAASTPKITKIEVTGNHATISIVGGSPPYTISNSWNSDVIQNTNTLINIPKGLHTIFVKDSRNCEVIKKQFLILDLINVITPDSDGKNDVLDYSDLRIKKDVKIQVFDRFGTMVHQSQNNNFLWDGKMNGHTMPSGTYWYVLNWIEPDNDLPVLYKGWVLSKNRN